jgi:hypothetical protein
MFAVYATHACPALLEYPEEGLDFADKCIYK